MAQSNNEPLTAAVATVTEAFMNAIREDARLSNTLINTNQALTDLLNEFRNEIRAKISELRVEINGLRSEMGDLRVEVGGSHAEMMSRFDVW
jgi:peptidoglycan hydrolase CwlO-like protein